MTSFGTDMLDPVAVAGATVPAVLVYLRIQTFLLAMPAFGERGVPARVKVGIALALTPLFAGAAGSRDISDAVALVSAALGEAVLGFLMGMQLRLMAAVLSIAASAIAATASLSQLVGGDNEMAPHPIGNLLHLAGLALLMAMGLPVMLASYIDTSFTLWPSGGLPDAATVASLMVELVIRGFGLAMVLASPFILGGVLYQALAGVVGKVMPSLPIVFVGAPAAILLALTGMALFAASILGVWADAMLDLDLRAFAR